MTSRDTQILGQLIRHLALEEHDPLTPLIDDYLIKRGSSPNRLTEYVVPLIERNRPGGRISPSGIGGCKRQQVFTFIGAKGIRRLDPHTELIFDDGNWAHHKWDARFLDMEQVLGRDRFRVIAIEKAALIPELYVAGSFDAVIWIAGKKYVVDFKTILHHGFQWVYRSRKPKEAHVKQLVAYCVALGIKRGMIIYDDKDSPDYLVFSIKISDKDWRSVERWCKSVIQSVEKEELPKRHSDCDNGNFLYERCPFAAICYGPLMDKPAKMRAKAFRDFEGLNEAWAEGMANWQ